MDNLWIIYGWLVGGIATPLKNMSSSIGMMTFPTDECKNRKVPNHQPDLRNELWVLWVLWMDKNPEDDGWLVNYQFLSFSVKQFSNRTVDDQFYGWILTEEYQIDKTDEYRLIRHFLGVRLMNRDEFLNMFGGQAGL